MDAKAESWSLDTKTIDSRAISPRDASGALNKSDSVAGAQFGEKIKIDVDAGALCNTLEKFWKLQKLDIWIVWLCQKTTLG